MSSYTQAHLTEVKNYIRKYYRLREIKEICFNLGIPYDDLPGDTLQEKTIELVDYCQRYDRVLDLLRALKEDRPTQYQRYLSTLPATDSQLPIQPQKMAQLDQLYQLLQQYIDVSSWSAAQEVARQIQAQHPDYRETNELAALAQERQTRQAETEQLYQRLQTAVAAADWDTALTLAAEIEKIVPFFRDVDELAKEARYGRRQQRKARWPSLLAQLRQLPWWAWGGGLFGLAALVLLLLRLGNGGFGGGATPTATLDPSVPPLNAQQGGHWTRPSDGMVMVYVPGGTFMMGSDPAQDPNAEGDEFPQHEVTLSNFWMDQTEITNAMYTQCVTDAICTASSYAFDSNYNGANYPVVGISGNDAIVYCEWVGGQLPTEAQWEYAARGEEGTLYPWGNEFDSKLANFCDTNCEFEIHDIQANDGYARTAPVGHYSPAGDSWVGAADMAGNVREWVANRYDTYEKDSVTNPIGPESGDRMVLRGGSWLNNSQSLRAAFRDDAYLHDRYIDIGFRCVVSPGS